ncbi:hypothetical protein G6F35_018094 [Rhizopus arrhizus]|nr:hypothetical protein G6F35_018094 [Rhizopus arrhizus]
MRARPAKTATQRLISISVAQSDSTMAGSITGPPAACSWSCFAPTSMPAAGLSPSPRSTAVHRRHAAEGRHPAGTFRAAAHGLAEFLVRVRVLPGHRGRLRPGRCGGPPGRQDHLAPRLVLG